MTTAMHRVRLGDVRPNPFRNIDRYPINRDKVDRLKESINRTDFWDNIVGRAVGDGGPDTVVEIAYGHHRLTALRELFPPDYEVGLIVRDLPDVEMLHMMADENMQEWASSGAVIIETVRAVRDFLSISVSSGKLGNAAKSNGSADIVTFLGWPEARVEDALSIIRAEEAGTLAPEDTAGLELKQATALRQSVARIHDPVVKAKAISRVREEFAKPRRERIGFRGVPDVVAQVKAEADPPKREVLPNEIANRIALDIERFWTNGIPVRDRTFSRREVVQLIAANRNAEGVRQYIRSITRALREMTKTNSELLAILEAERVLESVS